MKFLEPSITRRIEQIVKENEVKHEKDYKHFDDLLSTLKKTVPEHLHGTIAEIEDMYIQRVEEVEPIYRTGFEDCSKLINFVLRYDVE
ncbi:hypothetical protein [Paenibacillus sp. S29]|uniref:hypothetical protein n=1 Tax=Paenibacillus sp. S29 TaxID=3394611 RepID=UPI0039BFBE49